MARKDDIFLSFLQHPILKEKYELKEEDLPKSVKDGINSAVPIVKAIALIVDSSEGATPTTDKALQNSITQYLNTAV